MGFVNFFISVQYFFRRFANPVIYLHIALFPLCRWFLMIPRQLRKQKSAKRYPQIGSNVINPSRLGFVLFYFFFVFVSFRFCFPILFEVTIFHPRPWSEHDSSIHLYYYVLYIMYEMIIRTVHLWIFFWLFFFN